MITRKEEQILLSVVLLEDKAYLVNVRQVLKDMTGRYHDVGSINKTLKKLEQDGYLTSELGAPQPVRGGKAIKFYAVSEKGYAVLAEVRDQQQRFWEKIVLP